MDDVTDFDRTLRAPLGELALAVEATSLDDGAVRPSLSIEVELESGSASVRCWLGVSEMGDRAGLEPECEWECCSRACKRARRGG